MTHDHMMSMIMIGNPVPGSGPAANLNSESGPPESESPAAHIIKCHDDSEVQKFLSSQSEPAASTMLVLLELVARHGGAALT